jgi:hypothetical protein
MMYGSILLAVIVSLVLVSCGGGGDGGGTPAPLSGVLIDSPVQGLPYSTRPSGLSGHTGPNGEFQYRPGDFISFAAGAMPLEALAQPVITPFTLLGRTSVPDVNHEWPVNLTRILMVLDTTLGTEVLTMPSMLPTLPVFIFTSPTFETDLASTGLPIVPKSDAIAHLKKQFAIWGSWATTSAPNELQVFTFLPDGTYLLAHDDDPSVAGGNDGMEHGTYRWNANTNVFTYTVAVNTDGTGGLSNPAPTQTPPYTFVIDGSGTTAVLHLGSNVSDEIHLTRVSDAGNPIVGAWKLHSPFGPGFSTVITFLADGTCTVVSDAIETVPAGMERGTYVFDTVTGDLTVTTTVDTNREFGFNDSLTLPASVTEHVVLSSSLTPDLDFMYIEEGTDRVFFDRIKVP